MKRRSNNQDSWSTAPRDIHADLKAMTDRILSDTGIGPGYSGIASAAVVELVSNGMDELAAIAYVERQMQLRYGGGVGMI